MPNVKTRLATLEARGQSLQKIAQARISGDMTALSDHELDDLIAALDAELGADASKIFRELSDADVNAIADGRWNDVCDSRARALLEKTNEQKNLAPH